MKKTFTLLSLLAFASMTFAQGPSSGAPDPTRDAADVISVFSGVYTDVNIQTWRTPWSSGKIADTTIDGNDMKWLSAMGVVGVETGATTIDATQMTHINVSIWSDNATVFKLKIVDFGPDGVYSPANQGGDDTEHEIALNTKDNPSEWLNYEIPLSFFTGLTTTGHIAQFILVAEPFGTADFYMDNMYFSKNDPEAEPTAAAADPTASEDDVISMFCDTYTDVSVDTWRTPWSAATLEDIMIDGNNVKKYTGVDVIGIEAVGPNLIDASDMDYFHVSVWSPSFTTFKIKLSDWGADEAFDGGDDTEHELSFDSPNTGEWIDYRIPMSDFTDLTNRDNLAQFILVAETRGIPTVYVDNMYFSKEEAGSVKNAALNNIKVYPNPATTTLSIDLTSNDSKISEVSISDIHGRTVSTEQISGSTVHELNVSTLKSGVYFVNLKGQNEVFTQRIVID